MLKTRITLGLLALGLTSTSIYAGTAQEMPLPVSNDINLTAPYQEGSWSFGGEALYWQPTNHNLNYVSSVSPILDDTGATVGVVSSQDNVDPDYHWGFRADIAYNFEGNGRYVDFAWEHVHGDDSDTTYINDSTALVTPYFGSSLTTTVVSLDPLVLAPADFISSATGRSDNDYDAADLVFGQKIDVGERIRISPFVGLRYADIDVTDSEYVVGTSFTDPAFTDATGYADVETEFQGVGIRFGSDAQINLGGGVSVRGRVGLSLLAGNEDYDSYANQTDYDAAGNQTGTFTAIGNRDSETRVVPEADARLGLNYTCNMDQGYGFGIEAGWQMTNYFDVVDNSAFSAFDTTSHNNDFGIQGPYVRLQLDVA